MIQTIIVMLMVAAAVWYLFHWFRAAFKAENSCTGCGGCSGICHNIPEPAEDAAKTGQKHTQGDIQIDIQNNIREKKHKKE